MSRDVIYAFGSDSSIVGIQTYLLLFYRFLSHIFNIPMLAIQHQLVILSPLLLSCVSSRHSNRTQPVDRYLLALLKSSTDSCFHHPNSYPYKKINADQRSFGIIASATSSPLQLLVYKANTLLHKLSKVAPNHKYAQLYCRIK